MSDRYFTKVGTKAAIRSKATFTHEGAKPELLLDYYRRSGPRPIESNLIVIDSMFQEWCDLLFNQFNVVVQGRQSSFRLLETFKKRYLDSGKIPDFHRISSNDESHFLDITTVRMHGFCPISLEQFSHSLFNVRKSGGRLSDLDIEDFLEETRSTRCHYVFLIHSFELFYKECKQIFDIILTLYKKEQKYIHLILSASHIFAGKLSNKLKHQLNLVSFRNKYCDSFFYERIQCTSIEAIGDEKDEATSQLNKMFGGEVSFQSLKDVYEALQEKCREVLVYIIDRHLQKIDSDEGIKKAQPVRKKRKATLRAATTNDEDIIEEEIAELESNELLEYCQSKFILTRNAVLQNYLGELRDHRIVEFDSSGKRIRCLPSKVVCENFLKFIKSLNGTNMS